jgi:hypothetical protein
LSKRSSFGRAMINGHLQSIRIHRDFWTEQSDHHFEWQWHVLVRSEEIIILTWTKWSLVMEGAGYCPDIIGLLSQLAGDLDAVPLGCLPPVVAWLVRLASLAGSIRVVLVHVTRTEPVRRRPWPPDLNAAFRASTSFPWGSPGPCPLHLGPLLHDPSGRAPLPLHRLTPVDGCECCRALSSTGPARDASRCLTILPNAALDHMVIQLLSDTRFSPILADLLSMERLIPPFRLGTIEEGASR